MKRRSFLKSSSFLTLPTVLNGLPLAAVGKSMLSNFIDDDNDKILVLIQLNGGNDGLNTIIPLDHYDLLANVRSNIVIPENDILAIDSAVGFHPRMAGMQRLYDDARMAVIQDAGYPNQNRSHFRSSDIWTSGSPADEFWTSGWLGRYFENRFNDYPEGYPNTEYPDPFALSIGSVVSETCQGTLTNFSLAITDPSSISPLATGGADLTPDSNYGRELAFLRSTIEQANAYGGIITEAAEKGGNVSLLYDDNSNLHRQLKSIALLISGGLKTKVYVANIGGFDTHANQVVSGEPMTGEHADLLGDLSGAVEAFQDDLQQLGIEERVLTMTFSEFGRRIRSNDSLGTDHGTAAPVLLFGSCISAGILGQSPTLPDQPTGSDGVPMQFDFRSIYGTVLTDWFGVDEAEVKTILYDDFSPLPFIRSCDMVTSTDDVFADELVTTVYPNPFAEKATIQFLSRGETMRISVFDAVGHEISLLANQYFSEGQHQVTFHGSGLKAGNYFCRIAGQRGQAAKVLVKI